MFNKAVLLYFCFLWHFTFVFCGILLLLFVVLCFCFLWYFTISRGRVMT